MKCKFCDGSGKDYWCLNGEPYPCPVCNGTGEYEPFDADVELDKLYPTEQTNEEWFCQLPTEENAKRIINIAVNSNCDYETIVKWLKQPHTPNKE